MKYQHGGGEEAEYVRSKEGKERRVPLIIIRDREEGRREGEKRKVWETLAVGGWGTEEVRGTKGGGGGGRVFSVFPPSHSHHHLLLLPNSSGRKEG